MDTSNNFANYCLKAGCIWGFCLGISSRTPQTTDFLGFHRFRGLENTLHRRPTAYATGDTGDQQPMLQDSPCNNRASKTLHTHFLREVNKLLVCIIGVNSVKVNPSSPNDFKVP